MEGAIVHSIKHSQRHNRPEGSMFLAKKPPKRDTNVLQQAHSKYWQTTLEKVGKRWKAFVKLLPNIANCQLLPTYHIQGDFNCGASFQAHFILNYFLSNFLNFSQIYSNIPKFPQISSQILNLFYPCWQAGTITATLYHNTLFNVILTKRDNINKYWVGIFNSQSHTS